MGTSSPRWTSLENVARFQKLLETEQDSNRKKLLEDLLSAEQRKLAGMSGDAGIAVRGISGNPQS